MSDLEYRYADFEFRQTDDGLGIVEGTIIRYGDVATFPWGTEEIKAGAFGDVEGADLIANRMHERTQPLARTGAGLTITDSAKENERVCNHSRHQCRPGHRR